MMQLRRDQGGMVSIMVTLMFVLIAALVVVGFTQLASRNSRQALDRQLSTQAQYAAETAINDAQSRLVDLYRSGAALPEQEDCTGTYTKNGGAISDGVSYTCLMVDATPEDVSYSNVSDNPIVFPLNSSTGSLGAVDVTWQKSAGITGTASVTGCPSGTADVLPLATNWPIADCSYGLMRIELIPNEAGTFAAAGAASTLCAGNFVCDMNSRVMTVYAVPSQNSGSVTQGQATVNYLGGANRHISSSNVTQGVRVVPRCTTADGCRITITGLGFQYAYARVSMMYADASNLQVGYTSGGTPGRTFTNSQVIVDATGKAQDVLHRLQVRLSLSGSSSTTGTGGLSDYAIQTSGSLCKKFAVAPGSPGLASDQSGCTN